MRSQNFSFEILCKKKVKNKNTKNHLICVKHEEKPVKEIEIHDFLVCACKFQDFLQSQTFFAPLHERETLTLKNLSWDCFYLC